MPQHVWTGLIDLAELLLQLACSACAGPPDLTSRLLGFLGAARVPVRAALTSCRLVIRKSAHLCVAGHGLCQYKVSGVLGSPNHAESLRGRNSGRSRHDAIHYTAGVSTHVQTGQIQEAATAGAALAKCLAQRSD